MEIDVGIGVEAGLSDIGLETSLEASLQDVVHAAVREVDAELSRNLLCMKDVTLLMPFKVLVGTTSLVVPK